MGADASALLICLEPEVALHPFTGLPFFERGGGRQAIENSHRRRHVLASPVEERGRSSIFVELLRTSAVALGITFELGAISLERKPCLLELPLLCLEPHQGRLRWQRVIPWCRRRRRHSLPYRGFSIQPQVFHEPLVDLRHVAFQPWVMTPGAGNRPGLKRLLCE